MYFNKLGWQTVLLTLGLTGCAVLPEPLTMDERKTQIKKDITSIFSDQEPIKGPVTLYEAMSRAIKYNLDHRLQLMEDAVARGQLELMRFDLLPTLTASAGYEWRDNESGSSSQALTGPTAGQQSLVSSTSQERVRDTSSVSMAWNVLDFGVSYARAQQQADQVLITEERRRKVVQNIIQDVRFAYWKAMSADNLITQMDELMEKADSALKRSNQLEKLRLRSPLQALTYQKALLEIVRQMWNFRQELASAKTELATLMNLKPGSDFRLALPGKESFETDALRTSIEDLENMALLNRPELIEEQYQARISALEVKKAMLKMLPGLEINTGHSYDSNKFLFNNQWSDFGLQVSWNIFNLFSGKTAIDAAKAKLELDNTRRLSMSMAVLTQVRLAYQRYHLAIRSFEIASSLVDVESRIRNHTIAEKKANTSNDLEVIRSTASALAAQMQYDLGYAELQNSLGRIYNSIGMDPVNKEITAHDLEMLEEQIRLKLENWSTETPKLE